MDFSSRVAFSSSSSSSNTPANAEPSASVRAETAYEAIAAEIASLRSELRVLDAHANCLVQHRQQVLLPFVEATSKVVAKATQGTDAST
mmetsp:Transcript_5290/g.10973  ORF Transcript_5290/g.10973 Transcript_5290/m.10973 type:complete len:89 (-) Transcript_5290:2443-2709(-)